METSPIPSLVHDTTPELTNTAALLLPHQSLFAPSILQILREHYASFGLIAHWAPVRAFGRVIIVWTETEGCEVALRRGDFLKLNVDLSDDPRAEQQQAQDEQQGRRGMERGPIEGEDQEMEEVEEGSRRGYPLGSRRAPCHKSVDPFLPPIPMPRTRTVTQPLTSPDQRSSASSHSHSPRSTPTRPRSTSPHLNPPKTSSSHPPEARPKVGSPSSKKAQTPRR